jgi:hypothetical protein
VASFEPEHIAGPWRVQREGNFTADFYFTVALPDGAEGHAVVGTGDVTEGPRDEPARFERVALALNRHADDAGYDAVVAALKSADGLRISLTGH